MVENAVSIGKIVATVGLKGEMILKHSLGGKSSLTKLEALFVELQKGSLVPYFIKEAKAKTATETLVLLEGISTPEEAKKIIQKSIWLAKTDFDQQVKPNAIIGLIGFLLIDDKQPLGNIHEVIEQPHQVICTVFVEGKEVLIPLNESTLKKIDRKNNKVFVTLPEGLLDVYLK